MNFKILLYIFQSNIFYKIWFKYLYYMGLKNLINICSSLNITAPQLFAFDVKPQEPDKLLSQLLIYVKKLTNKKKKQVIEIIKTFK